MTILQENLAYLREENNLNQVELPDLLGIKNGTWSDYERGKSNPKYETLIKISDYFQVSIDDLLRKKLKEEAEKGNLIEKAIKSKKSNLKSNPIGNLTAKTPEKHPVLNDEGKQYGPGTRSADYWRDKYIDLLEKKVAEKPTAYVPLETYEVLATRFDALQRFVLEHLAPLNKRKVEELAVELHARGNDLMKSRKKNIHSDTHS